MRTLFGMFAACVLGASAECNPIIQFLAVTGRPTDAELARKVADPFAQ